ncbi:TPA_asm: hypothetical protein HUJ06_031916 [Nelumbo nucifera]|uniref:Uncharacterized protein n=1 Tax=Nelumbo nucifera TaxID=4432 RepID=A0A822ZXJ6_NELNU|nr:TPA_asm: hypothetical protein HUJ06_031916 [Nelumbo nucifera]
MVRVFGRSFDRDQSFIPRCVGIPFFLVIDMGKDEKD